MKDFMKVFFFCFMLIVFVVVVFVVLGVVYVDVDFVKSKVFVVLKQMNVLIEGVFKKFFVQVKFDLVKVVQGSVQMMIDVVSFDFGDKMYNDQVVGKDWFDVKIYLQVIFVLLVIVLVGGNKYNVIGKLMIKGKVEIVMVFVMVV